MKGKGSKNAQIRLIRAQFFVQHVGILLASVKKTVRTQNTSPQPIIYFRHKKYRLVPPLESFWPFQFFPIIAVIKTKVL